MRMNWARYFNRKNGCSTFNHLNVGIVPYIDILEANAIEGARNSALEYDTKIKKNGR